MGMRNDGTKSQKPVNGFLPTSFRTLSGYLRTVSSGASSVASSVRSAGASVASSLVDKDGGDANCDQVLWAGFDKLECGGDNIRRVLLLGYQSGFQVWDVEEADNVRELASRYDGPVSFLQMQPKPKVSKTSEDKFTDLRPLLVVVGDGSSSGGGNVQDGLGPSYNGNLNGSNENTNGNFVPSVVRFYSLASQSYVHVLKFRTAVYSLRCSPRVVAISQETQIHCFDATTLEREYTILTYPIVPNCLGPGGIGYGPLAVGPRWIAYSGYPVEGSDTGRVSPQHLTHSASLSGSPSNGSLVAHYAKESSKQLAAGIVTLGDIGYKKLSRYCSEFLPDNSLKSGTPNWRINGDINGHSLDEDSAGMVIVRDIVCKSVIVQFRAHKSPISALCFDPSGTLLVTASVQGHNINVFRIMPSCPGSSSGSDSGQSCVHLYRLQRGFTNAVIQDISFSEDSRWIMISSSRGTNHLFAISPSGGTVQLHSDDGNLTTGSTGFGVSTKQMARSSTISPKLNQQSLCAAGPPVTLSVVSRIKNGNNGWIGTVSGAAAAATGRVGSLSGAIASIFHNCKRNNVYAETGSLKTKYHLLVFSPGSMIQYALRPSSGPDSRTGFSEVSSGSFESSLDSDARLVVDALQKWDIRRRRYRRDREDNTDIFGEHGNGDSNKVFPEGMIRGASNRLTKGTAKGKISAEDSRHLYISEAELQMHQSSVPLWARPEIYFHMIMTDNIGGEDEKGLGGETEIENIPTRMVAARTKDLIPVYDQLQTQKLSHPRSTLENSRSKSHADQKSPAVDDGKLSLRCSYNSLDCLSEGGAASVAEIQSSIGEASVSSPRMSRRSEEGPVNRNGGRKMKTQSNLVNNRENRKKDTHLDSVNSNRKNLKMENQSEDDHRLN
ncbi:hypothetical protein MKW94_006816 [Papaver nudicaule]|uniref:BCAS3 domain-containing protein n=1 Tax=Papaver nudicaule TaxID=74823 RepID=A0AA41SHN8_PAPNU|nr:hypothetical protein [Papaver nudicaule]